MDGLVLRYHHLIRRARVGCCAGRRCVAALLAAQADMERAEAKLGRTALHVATSEGHAAVVEQLLSAGANYCATFSKLKVSCVGAPSPRSHTICNTLFGLQAIAAGFSVTSSHSHRPARAFAPLMQRTALHTAAAKGKPAVVYMLLEAGADAETRDASAWGSTALHLAAEHGHVQYVCVLPAMTLHFP